jgi:hypothetical protein
MSLELAKLAAEPLKSASRANSFMKVGWKMKNGYSTDASVKLHGLTCFILKSVQPTDHCFVVTAPVTTLLLSTIHLFFGFFPPRCNTKQIRPIKIR